MDYSKLTLAELLSNEDKVIRQHATGILKQFQRKQGAIIIKLCSNCYKNESTPNTNVCLKCLLKHS